VVDCCVGLARREPPVRVTPHTLFFGWSVAKPVVAMAIHLLVERGLLALDDPVARVWPEFAQNGKEHVTIRHVLAHRGGFPQTPESIAWEKIEDWSTAVQAMQELRLEWEPGTAVQYHPLNYGWVLGEVVRRVDGRPVEVFAAQEFFVPLGMSDTYLKVGNAELERAVEMYAPDNFDDGVQMAAFFNLPLIRRAVIPASNIHTTARDFGRFYQMLLNGGELDRVRVLAPASIAQARMRSSRPGERERDHHKLSYRAHGFNLGGHADSSWGGEKSSPTTFGYNGNASNAAWADPERNLVCVILNNGLLPDEANDRRIGEISSLVLAACDRT
jgi:CubicO group peptidase (beta-lactamase class C family)